MHSLISSYDLLQYLRVVRSAPGTYKDLRKFHSELYIDHLKSFTEVDDDYVTTAQDEEYGIGR